MEILDCYKTYLGIKLHFTTDYDYVKYSGKINASLDSFESRNDKMMFIKLAKKYSKIELIHFLIFNFVEGSTHEWVGDLLSEEADEIYKKHQKIIESMSYHFRIQCEYLFMNNASPNELLLIRNGNYPILLTKLLHKEISMETFCILNKLLNFMDSWNKKIVDTVQWPMLYTKVQKFSCFFPSDMVKYKNILKEVVVNHK